MRLYIEDQDNGEKTYLKELAVNREELVEKLGSERFKIKDKIYGVEQVKAEPSKSTAPAMALGGVIGVVGGVPGVLIGGIIGGLLGKNSDDEDVKRVSEFNGSKHASKA